MPVKIQPQDAIKKMQEMWPDYDFSKFVYTGSYSESIVICPTHGEITRTFKNVTRKWGHACSRCTSNAKKDGEVFLEEIKNLYPDTWHLCDYSKMVYTNAQGRIIVTCKEHGEFTAYPYNLAFNPSTYVCPKCNIRKRSLDQVSNSEEFINRAQKKYPGLDRFHKVNYVSSKDLVELECVKHGQYFITPGNYFQGQRCSHCARTRKSGPELEVFEYVKSLRPDCISRIRPLEDRRLELDMFIPDLKLGIEFNGLFFHRETGVEADKRGDKMASKTPLLSKAQAFSKMGIRIVHIFEDEWLYKKEIVKAKLSSILGKSIKIPARKCKVVEITEAQLKTFEIQNHIQGHAMGAAHRYGLVYNHQLVCCMSFSKLRFEEQQEGVYELLRFSSCVTVVGGFSKLLAQFCRTCNPTKIISYSDRRWSQGNVYLKTGFHLSSTSPPGYFWCKRGRRYGRTLFQRHKLDAFFGVKHPVEMTEVEIMYQNDFFKITDCGQDKWVLNLTSK